MGSLGGGGGGGGYWDPVGLVARAQDAEDDEEGDEDDDDEEEEGEVIWEWGKTASLADICICLGSHSSLRVELWVGIEFNN